MIDLGKVKYPDLLAKATDAFDAQGAKLPTEARNVIYDALEAERDRCARIAINNGHLRDYDEALYQRKSIEAAIRNLNT